MKKPLIGITNGMGLAISSMNMEHPPINQHRLNDSYVQAVIRAGGIPVILPPCEDASLMEAMVDGVDGVILSGGGDLDPALFGQRPTGKLGGVSPRRDAAELAVADYVLNKTEKPLQDIRRKMIICLLRTFSVVNVRFASRSFCTFCCIFYK